MHAVKAGGVKTVHESKRTKHFGPDLAQFNITRFKTAKYRLGNPLRLNIAGKIPALPVTDNQKTPLKKRQVSAPFPLKVTLPIFAGRIKCRFYYIYDYKIG